MGASPYTTIKLMRRYPCGPDYENSLYFANVVAQTNYMNTLVFKTFTNQSFQRPSRGRIRLQVPFTDSETVNYLAWDGKKNPNVASDVWYYAFVTGVKYINEAVTEFEYRIDIIQTYWWLTTLRRCLVERETVSSDEPYEHLVDEGISVSEYYNARFYEQPSELSDIVLIIAATFDKNFEDAVIGRRNGLFGGITYNLYNLTDEEMQDAVNFLLQAKKRNLTEGIVSCFYAPKFLFTQIGGTFIRPTKEFEKFTDVKRSNGTSVHNNKLLSYPFTYLMACNNAGDSLDFKYELFNGDNCRFTYAGDTTCSPGVLTYPSNYSGYGTYMTLGISGYPICSYTNDAFKAWLSQNASSFIGSKAKQLLGKGQAVAGAQMAYSRAYSAMGNAQVAGDVAAYESASASASMSSLAGWLAIGGIVLDAAQTVGEVAQASMRPDNAVGVGSSATLYCAGKLNFSFIARCVHPKYVDQIDDYFDMYGYKINTIKIPDTHSRPHWNYVKTHNCDLVSYCGNVVASEMKQIFNKGIRFWRNGAEVGQYNLNNRPVYDQLAAGTMTVEEAKAYEA